MRKMIDEEFPKPGEEESDEEETDEEESEKEDKEEDGDEEIGNNDEIKLGLREGQLEIVNRRFNRDL
ncbi:hypothetical protein DAPPUDRAFT_241823 [Daphnia pulex]|uniref:Uncharacterized protein n=1 Tax=Daphnia pulex TaxID=6669 RepID=E9GF63_DAPPU|nr:hypothetical protein DAPPUDRAFT_241823 [Daphnia pulex]|eukprot:EFX81949.1 hypothetical protein DAPPUDRAFT_241823 [Daphnia pulex]